MNLASLAIEKRAVTYFTVLILFVGGIGSFMTLGWLEDPEFTVKTAAIVTPYPGASAKEVELEVTDRIEQAIQEMPQLKELYSISRAGLSIVRVDIKPEYGSKKLPQVWDEMRSKIKDINPLLPPGAGEPDIGDDFGFVYGFLLALTSSGFTDAELERYAKQLKKELSVVPGVARVSLWGVRHQAVYVNISQQQLTQLGLTPAALQLTLTQQNVVVDAGSIDSQGQRFRIAPTGAFSSPEEIGELTFNASIGSEMVRLIKSPTQTDRPGATGPTPFQSLVKLRDVATIESGYLEPPMTLMRHNGKPAIAIALANVAGVNIVDVGKRIDMRLAELMQEIPVGVEVERISWQSYIVDQSIRDFMISLAEAVAIVLVVLALPMGWRMGVIIGSGLILQSSVPSF